jgi:hypothetical protein
MQDKSVCCHAKKLLLTFQTVNGHGYGCMRVFCIQTAPNNIYTYFYPDILNIQNLKVQFFNRSSISEIGATADVVNKGLS